MAPVSTPPPPHPGHQLSVQGDLPFPKPLQPTHPVQPPAHLDLLQVKMLGAHFQALTSTEDAEGWRGHSKHRCCSIPGEKGWEALKLYPTPREGFRSVCIKQDEHGAAPMAGMLMLWGIGASALFVYMLEGLGFLILCFHYSCSIRWDIQKLLLCIAFTSRLLVFAQKVVNSCLNPDCQIVAAAQITPLRMYQRSQIHLRCSLSQIAHGLMWLG